MPTIKVLGLGSIILVLSGCQSWRHHDLEDLQPTQSSPQTSQTGVVKARYWSNVSGDTISELTALPAYPDSPDQVTDLTELSGPQDSGDNYGSLVRGYITPPADGLYTFYVTGDDETQFSLSPSEDPGAAEVIARVPGWTNPGEYTKYNSQISGARELIADNRYFFEIIHKEGTGGDHFSVYWSGPGISRQIIGSGSIASLGQAQSADLESVKQAYSLGYRVGFLDGLEGLNFDPQYPFLDEDQDGLYDNWELVQGLDPNNPDDARSDPDNDLLAAAEEFLIGTRENNADTDGDGIPDGAEFAYELDPLNPTDASEDMDGDGYSNLEEYAADTVLSDPADQPGATAPQVSGFVGQYFEGTDFDSFVLARQDQTIDFSWGREEPLPELPQDYFSVRWTGMFTPPHSEGSEQYEFTTVSDDGVRLVLDQTVVIDQWQDQGATAFSHTISLDAQEILPVTVEYYEGRFDAEARLRITRLANGETISALDTVTAPESDSGSLKDTDGDGMPDGWELSHGLNPWIDDASAISNNAGITNLEAYQSALDPWTLEPTSTPGELPTTTNPEPEPQPEPDPALGEVTLTWTAPLKRADGSSMSLGEIDYYEIFYGQNSNDLSQSKTAPGDATSADITGLDSGTWYFSIRVIDTNGLASELSEPVEHLIP